MVINESSPLPSPGALGRALEAAAQEPPPAVAVHPVSLPTEETLLIWAVTMFLSGTGAVVALQTETSLKEMTVDLCMRIRLLNNTVVAYVHLSNHARIISAAKRSDHAIEPGQPRNMFS